MKTLFRTPHLWPLLGLLLVLFSLGCSAATGTIEGTVTSEGKPIRGVEVIFRDPGRSAEASGISNDQGKYRVFYGRGNRDLPTGQYQVSLGLMLPEDSGGAGSKLRGKVNQFNDRPRTQKIEAGQNIVDINVDSGTM